MYLGKNWFVHTKRLFIKKVEKENEHKIFRGIKCFTKKNIKAVRVIYEKKNTLKKINFWTTIKCITSAFDFSNYSYLTFETIKFLYNQSI